MLWVDRRQCSRRTARLAQSQHCGRRQNAKLLGLWSRTTGPAARSAPCAKPMPATGQQTSRWFGACLVAPGGFATNLPLHRHGKAMLEQHSAVLHSAQLQQMHSGAVGTCRIAVSEGDECVLQGICWCMPMSDASWCMPSSSASCFMQGKSTMAPTRQLPGRKAAKRA